MPNSSRGRRQTKRDILVLQVGVGREANNLTPQKLNCSETMERRIEADCSGGQSSLRAVAPRGRKEGRKEGRKDLFIYLIFINLN
jgi:hypothetical protein